MKHFQKNQTKRNLSNMYKTIKHVQNNIQSNETCTKSANISIKHVGNFQTCTKQSSKLYRHNWLLPITENCKVVSTRKTCELEREHFLFYAPEILDCAGENYCWFVATHFIQPFQWSNRIKIWFSELRQMSLECGLTFRPWIEQFKAQVVANSNNIQRKCLELHFNKLEHARGGLQV